MKLKDVTTIISGGTPSTKKAEFWNGSISWITPKDLSGYNKMYISKGERNITDSGLKNSSAYLIPKGSVLFSSRAPIGYVAIANNELCTNQGFKNFICDESKIDNIYLYYWLKNNVKTIEEFASGSTFKEISASKISNIEIELPSLTTQKKISNILSSLDKKIELNNQINNNLQELINNTFIEYFVNYNVDNNNLECVETESGIIPINWYYGTLADIVEFSNGYGFDSKKMLEKPEKDSYAVFKMGNINIGGGINKDKTKSWIKRTDCENIEKFIAKKGDILMCMTDMKNSGNPLLGHTALIDKDGEFVINQRVGILRCTKGISYEYVYTLSNLDFFINDLRSRANSGVQVNLTTSGICETRLLIPSKDILKKFDLIAKPLYEKKFVLMQENETLENLRDTLLPRLMNGQIDLDNIKI